MSKKMVTLISLVLVLGLAGNTLALELKVDMAYPFYPSADNPSPLSLERRARTLKPGWFPFSPGRWWDMSFHDPVFHCDGLAGCAGAIQNSYNIETGEFAGFPLGPDQIPQSDGIDGALIHASFEYGYEGDTSWQVAGMTFEGDGEAPTGLPIYDPICNSFTIPYKFWGTGDAGGRADQGSIYLTLVGEGLVPGEYTLESYHNCPYNPNDPGHKNPPGYDWYIEHDDPNSRIMPAIEVYGPEGSIVQIHDGQTYDVNVIIQDETQDANLIPSVVKFFYDGGGDRVVVRYISPPGDNGRFGGAAVLNAFILYTPTGGVPFAFKGRPRNGAVNVDPDVDLIWNPGAWAAQHDVYLGTDFNDVNDATPADLDVYRGRQDPNFYDPGRLQLGQTYHWRIDEVNDANSDSPWKGRIWRFTIDDGEASSPSPGDGADNVARDVVLAWEPGTFAVSHDVYFGTSYQAVKDGTAFIGNQTDPNFDPPGELELRQTYYWRIDEKNPGYTDATSPVWSFTAIAYLVIEDVESYANITELTDVWKDGYIDWSSGSWLKYLGIAPDQPVHGGNQSIEYLYDNDIDPWTPQFSEIERVVPEPHDWAGVGVKVLKLYFYGDPDNDVEATEQMYVGLDDSGDTYAEVRYPQEDMADIQKEEWTEWAIMLPDFNDVNLASVSNDVNLASVNKIYIGFGDRENPVAGGRGTVYFDDIRLYIATCVPEEGPAADFSGDCLVNEKDLKIMADEWLETDGALAPVEPTPGSLRLLYKFDEATGTSALDSSGNGYNGTVDANGADNWDSDGKFGRCLNFDETFGVTVPSGVFSGLSNAITIGVWVNGDPDQNDIDNVIFQAGRTGGTPQVVTIRTRWQSDWVEFRTGTYGPDDVRYDVSGPEDWAGQWNHYAFTKDASAGTMEIYHNGLSVAKEANKTASMSGIAKVKIGAASDRWGDAYVGKLDDFRIYNYALSQAEIASIMGLAELYLPLPKPEVDLYLDGDVNFKDYAKLVDSWLTRKLWPE